jgi:hypothetical protein
MLAALALAACVDPYKAYEAAIAPPPAIPEPAPEPAPVKPPGILRIDSFEMLELLDGYYPGHHYYAPRIHVSAINGPLYIKRLTARTPGGDLSASICGNITVTADTLDLTPEVFGEYELRLEYPDGRRAEAGVFTVEILFADPGSGESLVTLAALATPADPPGTTLRLGPWNPYSFCRIGAL